MSQKREEIRAKNHPGLYKIAPFFFGTAPTPLQRSLAPSKLNLAAPVEIRWLRLCQKLSSYYLFTNFLAL